MDISVVEFVMRLELALAMLMPSVMLCLSQNLSQSRSLLPLIAIRTVRLDVLTRVIFVVGFVMLPGKLSCPLA